MSIMVAPIVAPVDIVAPADKSDVATPEFAAADGASCAVALREERAIVAANDPALSDRN
jgi:hypothetical protein